MGPPREVNVGRRQDAGLAPAVRDWGREEAGNASDINEGKTAMSVLR